MEQCYFLRSIFDGCSGSFRSNIGPSKETVIHAIVLFVLNLNPVSPQQLSIFLRVTAQWVALSNNHHGRCHSIKSVGVGWTRIRVFVVLITCQKRTSAVRTKRKCSVFRVLLRLQWTSMPEGNRSPASNIVRSNGGTIWLGRWLVERHTCAEVLRPEPLHTLPAQSKSSAKFSVR